MAAHIQASSGRERNMGRVLTSGQMALRIRGNGTGTRSTVLESTHGQMADVTAVAGSRTSCTEKASTHGLTGGSTKETTTGTRNMALDCMSGLMASPMKDTGSKASAMDKVSSVTLKVNSVSGSGLRGREKSGCPAASNK